MTESINPQKAHGARRCIAKSKRSGQQCQRWAMVGVTKCKNHGGAVEGKPAKHATKHGQLSQYYSEAEVDKLLKYRRELDTVDGQVEALKDNYAKIKAREERIPEATDFTELAIKAADSKRKDVLAIRDLTQEDKPDVPTTFIVNQFDSGQLFQSRTIDGPVTIRLIDGKPYIAEKSGAYIPASEHIDDESGARYFLRLIGDGSTGDSQ